MRDVILLQPEDFPQVMIGIFFDETTPFADVFFENVAKLIYPKDKVDIFIHYSVSRLGTAFKRVFFNNS